MAAIASGFFATSHVLKGLNTAEWRNAAAKSMQRARSDGPKWRKKSPKRSLSPMSPGRAKADGSKGSTSMRAVWDLVQGVDMQRTTIIKDSKDQIVKSFSSALVGGKRAASLSRWVVGNSITDSGSGGAGEEEQDASEKGAIKLPPPMSSTGMGRPPAKEPSSDPPMPAKTWTRSGEDWSSTFSKGAAGLTDLGKGLKMNTRWSLGSSASAPSLRPASGVRLSPIKRSDENSDRTLPAVSSGSLGGAVKAEKNIGSTFGTQNCKSSPDVRMSAMQEDLGIKPQVMTPKRLTPVKQHYRKLRRMEKRAGSVPSNSSLPSSPASNIGLRGMQSQIDFALTAGFKAFGKSDNKANAIQDQSNVVGETKKVLSFAEEGKDAGDNEDQFSDFDEDDLAFFMCSFPPRAEGEAIEESPVVEASTEVAFDALLAFDDYDEDLPFFELRIPARPTRGRSSSPPKCARRTTMAADDLGETLQAFRRTGTFCGSLPGRPSWEWPLACGEAHMCQQAFAGGWGLSHEALPMAATVA